MYSISTENLDSNTGQWGDYVIHKEFYIENKNINKNKNVNVNGFLVQIIQKTSQAFLFCANGYLKEIVNIEEFTSNQVKYMNDNYIELFPIIDGRCIYGDNFQNGSILKYEKYRGKFYANNNPPTLGKIEQIGTSFFIPIDNKDFVINVLKKIKSVKNKNVSLNILGMDWNFSNNTPANGLPFRKYNSYDLENLIRYKNSNFIIHNVTAEWNGIIKKDYEILKNIKKSNNINTSKNNCEILPYDNEEISLERELAAKTKIVSTIT